MEKIKIKLMCYNHIKNIPEIIYHSTAYYDSKIEKLKKNMNMYKYLDYLLYSSHEIQKLTYKINKKKKINIFGEKFVENNGNKCSTIYKDKIIPLQSYFLVKDISKEDKENKIFEILLLELEDISDRSYMFSECKSLIELSNFEIKGIIMNEKNF